MDLRGEEALLEPHNGHQFAPDPGDVAAHGVGLVAFRVGAQCLCGGLVHSGVEVLLPQDRRDVRLAVLGVGPCLRGDATRNFDVNSWSLALDNDTDELVSTQ